MIYGGVPRARGWRSSLYEHPLRRGKPRHMQPKAWRIKENAASMEGVGFRHYLRMIISLGMTYNTAVKAKFRAPMPLQKISTLAARHFSDVSRAPGIPWYPAVAIASGDPTTTVTTSGYDRSLLVDVGAPSRVFSVLNPGQPPILLLLPPQVPAPSSLLELQSHPDSDAPAARRLPSRMRPL